MNHTKLNSFLKAFKQGFVVKNLLFFCVCVGIWLASASSALAVAPGAFNAFASSNVATSSITIQWGPHSTLPTNSANLYVSTSNVSIPFSATNLSNLKLPYTSSLFSVSGGGYNGSTTSLLGNTTYYFTSRILGSDNALNPVVSTCTLAYSPGFTSFAVYGTSLTVNLATSTLNSRGTLYRVVVSSNGFQTVSFSSTGLTQSLSVIGLQRNTTYQVAVVGVNFNNLESSRTMVSDNTCTSGLAPGFNSFFVYSSSISINVLPNQNPVGTKYSLQISTTEFNSIDFSSSGVGSLLTVTGLVSNVSYKVRLVTLNSLDVVNSSASIYITTSTLAMPVSILAFSAADVGRSSMSVSWDPNGNSVNPPTFYDFYISTSPDFVGNNFGNNTVFTVADVRTEVTNLKPNTTYFFKVVTLPDAVDGVSKTGQVASTCTLAAAPGIDGFSIFASSLSVQLKKPSENDLKSVYRISVSSDDFQTISFSSDGLVNPLSVVGLTANQTYQLSVSALNFNLLETSHTLITSTITQTNPPVNLNVDEVGYSSITLRWDSNGNSLLPPTSYQVDISTDSNFTVFSSSETYSLFVTSENLLVGGQYFFRVRAYGRGGYVSNYSSVFSTRTLYFSPGNFSMLSSSDVGVSSVSLSWSSNGNFDGIMYNFQVSTAANFSVYSNQPTQNLSASSSTLLSNTTYYFRVYLDGKTNISLSTVTNVAAPKASGFNVYASSLTVSVQSSGYGNPELFQVQVSSDGFENISFSSAGFSRNLKVDGMQPNTTYQVALVAFNSLGSVSTRTVVTSTTTLAAQPTFRAFIFGENIGYDGNGNPYMRAEWNANGNPLNPPSSYYIQIATSADFTTEIASAFNSENLLSAAKFSTSVYTAITPQNQDYYFRVKAYGRGGDQTDFIVISTRQPAGTPQYGSLNVFNSSVSVIIQNNSNLSTFTDDLNYYLAVSTDGFQNIISSVSASTNQSPLVIQNLVSNTNYAIGIRVKNKNHIFSPYNLTIIQTVPNTAGSFQALTPADIGTSSITVTWTANGNSPESTYELQLSTSSNFTPYSSSQVQGLSYTASSLNSNTTYYFRAGIAGNYNATFATATHSFGISALNYGFWGSSATLVVAPNLNPQNTVNVLEFSVDDFATISASNRSSLSTVTVTNIPDLGGGVYQARIYTVSHGNHLSSATSVSAPGEFVVPVDSIGHSSITVSYARGGVAHGTLFNVDFSTDQNFSLYKTTSTTQLVAVATGLNPLTNYYFRIINGVEGNTPLSATTLLAPPTILSVDVFLSSALVTVDTNGNPPTFYRTIFSTNNFATLPLEGDLPYSQMSNFALDGQSYLFSLPSNVRGKIKSYVSMGGQRFYSNEFDLVTLPNPISDFKTFVSSDVGYSSVSVHWSQDLVSLTDNYSLYYTSDVSNQTWNIIDLSLEKNLKFRQIDNLLPNTTYYFKGSVNQAFNSVAATATLPVAINAVRYNLFETSVTLVVAENQNPLGTTNVLELSQDGFNTIDFSSASARSTITVVGLQPEVQYEARIYARNWNNIPSAMTTNIANPGPFESFTSEGVSYSSIAVNWSLGGVPAGQTFELQYTNIPNFATFETSSTKLTSVVVTGLLPRTLYYFRVKNNQKYNSIVSTYTLYAPVFLSNLTSVDGTNYRVKVDSGILDQNYYVEYTTTDFTTIPTQYPYLQTSNLNFVSNLTLNAIPSNKDVLIRAYAVYNNVKGLYSNIISTRTSANPTGNFQPITSANIYISSYSLVWGQAINRSEYEQLQLHISTASDFSVYDIKSLSYDALQYSSNDLNSNTTYYFRTSVNDAFNTVVATCTLARSPGIELYEAYPTSAVVYLRNSNPLGTLNTLELSADNFTTVSYSSVSALSTITITDIQDLGVTYKARVFSQNYGGLKSTYTVISKPGEFNPFVSEMVGSTEVIVSWKRGGIAQGNMFQLHVSTDSQFSVFTASSTVGLSLSTVGVSPNQLYYFRVLAAGEFNASISTYTAANPPVILGYNLADNSIEFNVSASSNPSIVTNYYLQFSTSNFQPERLDYPFTSVRPITEGRMFFNSQTLSNNTVQARIYALSLANRKAYSNTITFNSPANPPGDFIFSGDYAVNASSITLVWTPPVKNSDFSSVFRSGNYNIHYSTDSSFNVFSSSFLPILPPKQTISDLIPNTTYSFRVGSINDYNTVLTTVTLAKVPSVISRAVYSTSATFVFADLNLQDTLHVVELSTENFATSVFYSAKVAATTITVTGLIPDTTYAVRSYALNHIGARTSYVTSSQIQTSLAPLSDFNALGLNDVGSSSITFSWSSNGNPSSVQYQLQTSTAADFSVYVSSNLYDLSLTSSGLSPNTQLYARLRVIGLAQTYSAYNATISPFTRGLTPNLIGFNVYHTSVSVNFAVNGNSTFTVYALQVSSDGFSSVNFSSSGLNTSFLLTNLTPNTSYQFGLVSINALGLSSSRLVFASSVTPVFAPSNFAAFVSSNISYSSITVSWQTGGNFLTPPTSYQVQVSTSSDFVNATSSITYDTRATTHTFVSGATYYLRVRALGLLQNSEFNTIVTTMTLFTAPSFSVFSSSNIGYSSITVSWTNNNVPASVFNHYEIQTATMASFSSYVSSITYLTSLSTNNLLVGATYYFRLRAMSTSGKLSAFSPIITTRTVRMSPPTLLQLFATSGNQEAQVYLQTVFASDSVISHNSVTRIAYSTSPIMSFTENSSIGNVQYYSAQQDYMTSTQESSLRYRYIKWEILESKTNMSQVAEFRLLLKGRSVAWNGASISNPGGDNPVNEDCSKLIDGTNSKWLDMSAFPNDLIIDAGSGKEFQFDGYEWMTANDVPARDPISWKLYGSNDGSSWVKLDQRTNQNITTSRYTYVPPFNFVISSISITGLFPGTTYYFAAISRNVIDEWSVFTSTLFVGARLSAPAGDVAPTGPTNIRFASVVSTNSISVGFDPSVVGTNIDGFSQYKLYTATSNFTSVENSWVTISSGISYLLSTATVLGLNSNQQYYFNVSLVDFAGSTGSLYSTGKESAFSSVALTTITKVNPPGDFIAFDPSVGGAFWDNNGNTLSPPTSYELQISTSEAFIPFISSITFLTNAYVGNLDSNTLYHFRARAFGKDGSTSTFNSVFSTITPLSPPGFSGFRVYSTSLTVNVTPNGDDPLGTRYGVVVSSDNFATVNFSSSGLSTNLTVSGLQSNRDYSIGVISLGITNSSRTLVTSTYTQTNVAGNFENFTDAQVSLTSITVSWSANTNRLVPYTSYEVQVSTQINFAFYTSSITYDLNMTTVGLHTNTVYYFKVRAFDRNGDQTAFNTVSSTRTDPYSPLSINNIMAVSGAEQGQVRIIWQTTQTALNPMPNLTYRVRYSTSLFNFYSGTQTFAASDYYNGHVEVSNTNFVTESTHSFRYIKWQITETQTNQWISARAFRLVLNNQVINWPNATTVSAVASGNPVDGNDWIDYFSNNGIVFDAQVPITFNQYQWNTSLYSFSNYSPKSWKLYGSNDNQNWFLLDTQTGYGDPGPNVTKRDNVTSFAEGPITVNNLYPGTTYYFAVSVHNNVGGWSSFTRPNANVGKALTLDFPISPVTNVTQLLAQNANTLQVSYTLPDAPIGTDDRGSYRLYTATSNFTSPNDSWVSISSEVKHPISTISAVVDANQLYYFNVSALDWKTSESGFAAPSLSTVTPLNPPANFNAILSSHVGISSIAVSWGNNNNSLASLTSYQVQISTDSAFSVTSDSQTFLTSAVFTGLTINTRYYLRARAYGLSGSSSVFNSVISTVTLANPPGNFNSFAAADVSFSSIALSWSVNGNLSVPQTTYQVQISTNSNFSTYATSVTQRTSVLIDNLVSNTTYYFRARALGVNNDQTGYNNVASTRTKFYGISDLSGFESGAAQITLSWTTPQTLSGYKYEVRWSSYPGINTEVGYATATTFAQNWDVLAQAQRDSRQLTGLTPGTTIFVALRYIDADGKRSPIALSTSIAQGIFVSSAPQTPIITVAGTSGIYTLGFIWTDNSSNETGYRILSSSGGVLSADLPANTFVYTGNNFPGPNVVSTISVQAFNRYWTSISASTAIYTMVNQSQNLQIISSMGSSSFTIKWSSNNNPAYTDYDASVYFSSASSSLVQKNKLTNPSTLTYTFEGLTPNTSYNYRVTAINENGVTAANGGLSTTTLAQSPTLSRYLSNGSSLTVIWNQGSNPGGTFYDIQISSDLGFSPLLNSGRLTGNTSSYTGLAPNTSYYVRMRGVNNAGIVNNWNTFTSTITASAAATVSTYTVYVSSVVIELGRNNNTIGTPVTVSTTSNFVSSLSSTGVLGFGNPSAILTLSGLSPAQTNPIYVRTVDNLARSSSTLAGSFVTLPLAPVATNNSIVSVYPASMTVSWTNGNGNVNARYELVASSQSTYQIYASSVTNLLQATISNLVSDSTYYLRARALNSVGQTSNWESLGSTLTPVIALQSVTANIFISSAEFSWNNPGNHAETRYVVQLSSNGFNSVFRSSITTGTRASLRALAPETTYTYRVYSVGRSNLATRALTGSLTSGSPYFNLYQGIGSSSITVNWVKDQVEQGSTFILEIATVSEDSSIGTYSSVQVSNVSQYSFTNLSTNTIYSLRLFWQDPVIDGARFLAQGSTRTMAAVPPDPVATTLSFTSATLRFSAGSNPTADPKNTQFAIKMTATSLSGSPLTQHHNKYLPLPIEGKVNLDTVTSSSVWKTFAQWNNGAQFEIQKLVSNQIYSFYIVARNKDNVETAFSIPAEVRTFPSAPTISWLAGLKEESWVNFAVTSFTASNSAHYHYRFVQNETEVSGADVSSWGNGFDNNEVVSVTPSADGPWWFHYVGDSFHFPDETNQNHLSIGGVSKFKVNVDRSSPTVSNLTARFSPQDNTSIVNGQATAFRNIYLTWTSSITNATLESPIAGYSVLFSTSSDAGDSLVPLVIYTTAPSAYFTINSTGPNSPLRPAGDYYIRVKAKDQAGNWGNSSLFHFKIIDDFDRPGSKVLDVSDVKAHDDSFIALKPSDVSIKLNFDKPMKSNVLLSTGNYALVGIRDNMGNNRNVSHQVTVTYDEANKQLTIVPSSQLPKGWIFDLTVSSALSDLAGNTLSAPLSTEFSTLMDYTQTNRVIAADGVTIIEIPAYSFNEDVSVSVGVLLGGVNSALQLRRAPQALVGAQMHSPRFVSQGAIDTANSKILSRLGDYSKPVTIRDMIAVNSAGQAVKASSLGDIKVVLPYSDSDKDGYVDGTSPRIKAKQLAIYVLDENTNTWYKISKNTIDESNRTVSASLSYVSVYAVFGSADKDVSLSYAYPVPFKAGRDRVITFSFLPDQGEILIYNLAGQQVRKISFSNPTLGKLDWDTKDDSGRELGSDVYVYKIKSESQTKTGKLVIVR